MRAAASQPRASRRHSALNSDSTVRDFQHFIRSRSGKTHKFCARCDCICATAEELGEGLDGLRVGIRALEASLAGPDEAAILADMASLRATVDALERRVSSARWPLPKYRDMLFLY